MRRCDTEKPVRPAFGLAPRPVAPSSRISPPEPVAAPGNGEIAVGMIVRLHLHQDVDGLAHAAIDAARRHPGSSARPPCLRSPPRCRDTRRARRADCARACCGSSRTATSPARCAVDDPARVEDLVAAVLGVRLREHHQLDVGRIAAEPLEALEQVVDLVGRQRQAQRACSPARAPRARLRATRARSGCGCACSNSRAASAASNSTISVMRSNSAARERRQPLARRAARRRACDTRCRARCAGWPSSPQTCAISVALLDQGEMVPARGTTMQQLAGSLARPPPCAARRSAGARGLRVSRRVERALHVHEVHEARVERP